MLGAAVGFDPRVVRLGFGQFFLERLIGFFTIESAADSVLLFRATRDLRPHRRQFRGGWLASLAPRRLIN